MEKIWSGVNNIHLMYGPEGNKTVFFLNFNIRQFCFPEGPDVSTVLFSRGS